MSPLSELVVDAFDVSGFRLLETDGHILLMAEDADAYEVRVQRIDDADPHYMTVRGRFPLDVHEVWLMVRRAERWLRRPKRRLHGDGE